MPPAETSTQFAQKQPQRIAKHMLIEGSPASSSRGAQGYYPRFLLPSRPRTPPADQPSTPHAVYLAM
ncbi:hypothetical protein LY76DRAFT_589948 [Colletotrichum caudatum]|nr:hypothetical protein LY76DRAFT_589948 [Colletotrichum caudatum]